MVPAGLAKSGIDEDANKEYNSFSLYSQAELWLVELTMSSVQRRARHLESAISICVLAVLFLVGVGVFIRQSDFDISRFGINTPRRQPVGFEFQASTSERDQSDLGPLAPAGFEKLSETEVYNPGNLYEKINGKAPLYIESGFEQLSTQRFISGNDESLWMELYVYDMGAVRNAFSVYSVQKRAEAENLRPMRFAYKTANALYLVHGKYYIELVGSAESSELFRAITEVARKVRANLAIDHNTAIDELSLFPQENVVVDSARLYLKNAFGFEGLTDTFTSRYTIDGETITAFLSKRSSPEEARAAAESYYNFLIDNGGAAKPTESIEAKAVDFYDTTEIVFAIGPLVAGVHEAENQRAAEKLAGMLIGKLGEK